ncbi:PREDICTED: uncharacterized protein LOC108555285 [Eufriesea mexicana]|uniref:uncharacterized protein LOC108555285 n=1 Tax=Eufriesea mexicana TaxID=516756 RepID=UPI00083C62B1|nr:PREDICTED: uncharacterized protein LOC108555285 [Eufriesea mexicana]
MTQIGWNFVLPVSMLVANATVGNVTYDKLIGETIRILQCCTIFNRHNALLLAGEYEDFLQRSLLDGLQIALVSETQTSTSELFALSRYSFTEYNRYTSLHLLRKLDHFVVIASSQPMLRLLLQRIKDSSWGNFNGFHILIDRRTEERGCANAHTFLWTAWEYDRLSTIFLCIDPIHGLVLYTYNPYSSMAPRAWKQAGYYEGRSGHPWLLLRRKYRNGSRMCKDLMFDKTRDLNGYEIRLNAISFEPHLHIDESKSGLEKFTGDNSEILKMVFKKLNASMNVLVYRGTVYRLGGIDKHGIMVGMLADVASGEVDMGMNARGLYSLWKIEHTYPHGEEGFCVITQRAGEKSEFIKFLTFHSPFVSLGCAIVFVISLCILAKYQGFFPACLNMTRFVTSVSMYKLPKASSCRIFFTSVFILYFVVNALVLSHWASILSIPVSLPNIRTAEDLRKSGYQIYGSMFHEQMLRDAELRSRFHETTYHSCRQQVLRSRRAACIDDCLHQYVRIENEPLYRSRRIQRTQQVYVTRKDWPLLRPVTKIIRHAMESGLITMWRSLNTRRIYEAWKKRRMNRKKSFRILTIKQITFSFYILVIGQVCAIVTFVAEVIVGRYRARRSRR